MSVEVVNPFDSYRAQSGVPLDAGKLYVGIANLDPQTNPIEVFYDPDLTIAAPQPLTTSGGYVWRNGAPARIYTAASLFSSKLLDKNNVQVFYSAMAAGRTAFSDGQIKTWSGRTQEQKNKDNLSLYDFGYIADGTLHPLSEKYATLAAAQAVYPSATSLTDSIDTVAVQTAIDYCKSRGVATKIKAPSGISAHNKTIVWKNYAYFNGDSVHSTTFKKAEGFGDRLIITENFDALTGTDSALLNTPVRDFGIVDIKLDGNYMNPDQTAYINGTGDGNLYIYGTMYDLKIQSVNSAGVGVWLEYGSSESVASGYRRYGNVEIESYTHAEECVIFKGAPDIIIKKIWAMQGGQITSSDPRNFTLWSSRSYPTLGRIDNIVLATGVELELCHTWGCSRGYGFRAINGRQNIGLLISESCLGGVDIEAQVAGQISRIRVHNLKGGVTYTDTPHPTAGKFPNVVIASTSGLNIDDIYSDSSGSGQTGQTHVSVLGWLCSIGRIFINGRGKAGHGIKVTGNIFNVAQFIVQTLTGTSGEDGEVSTALIRDSAANSRIFSIKGGEIISCDLAFAAQGTAPIIETIEFNANNCTDIVVGTKSNITQQWRIAATTKDNVTKSSMWSGAGAVSTNITTHQSITIPHKLVATPPLSAITLTLTDTFTAISNTPTAKVQYMYISSGDSTNIIVHFKMEVATTADTSAFLCVTASI